MGQPLPPAWKPRQHFTNPRGDRNAYAHTIQLRLGHAHIGVTATVYAHVRLRLQRDAIDLLSNALRNPAQPTDRPNDGD